MCICVNCRHVHNCTTYKLIEQQHKKYQNNRGAFFVPKDTLIEVNINYKLHETKFDWDLKECLSFAEQPGYWKFV